jgi:hypothetical protein
MFDKASNPHGAYNLLCNPPPNPFNGGKRDGVFYLPIRRDEKLIGPVLTDAVPNDNCTETQVTPVSNWVNYAPNQVFVTDHGHYTVSPTCRIPHLDAIWLYESGVCSIPAMMRTVTDTFEAHVLTSLNRSRARPSFMAATPVNALEAISSEI